MQFLALTFLLGLGQIKTETTLQKFIQEIAPNLQRSRVVELSHMIDANSKRYGIDPFILASIVRQESGFRRNLKVCYIAKQNRSCVPTCDFGVSQINQIWIKKWNLSEDRLIKDDSYNIGVSARILKNLYDEFGQEENWYSRYNSSTPSSRVKYEGSMKTWITDAR